MQCQFVNPRIKLHMQVFVNCALSLKQQQCDVENDNTYKPISAYSRRQVCVKCD